MNIGWQYAREHIHPLGRSHSVINNGGDQPNVVPSRASIWYYFREITYPKIMEVYARANEIAEAAAMMTRTKMSSRVLGTAWPRHFNKVMALSMYDNIKQVGLPQWSEEDQMLAKAVQREVNSPRDTTGLALKLDTIKAPLAEPKSGGSDDIGDISWKLPTVTLRYPSNIPGLQGHHWSNAIAMATPIAHKGVVAGAKVEAMTILDFLAKPELAEKAWEYFRTEQSSKQKYIPMVSQEDQPAVHLNKGIMELYVPKLQPYYFDETKYDTYLEQLEITYPTLRKDQLN
jgi:aminobenzoyl-glutamate utilization protein B